MQSGDRMLISSFVEKQTRELKRIWYSCDPGSHVNPVVVPHTQKLENESRLLEIINWLGDQVETPMRGEEDRKRILIEGIQRLKKIGSDILGFSKEQMECFQELGIDRSAEEFFKRAHVFDPYMSTEAIFQAGRNVWTANYLQVLLGLPVELTPSIFGYSMLYPVSDNYLDDPGRSSQEKISFNQRFRGWLAGEYADPINWNEKDVFDLVGMIGSQYPPALHPQVLESLLAIQSAQEKSLRFQSRNGSRTFDEVLTMTFEKGGTSVLADGILAAGELSQEQMEIIFNYGAFAQLMDDQEDLENDLQDRSVTIFTLSASSGKVDETMRKVFCFAHRILKGMDSFHAERAFPLKQMSMKGIDLLLMDAIFRMKDYYSSPYLKELEEFYPFRFEFMDQVRKNIKRKKLNAERLIGIFSPNLVAEILY